MGLRDYQQEALNQLRLSLARGNKRPMLQAPTAFGKTKLAGAVVSGALAKNKRVIFCVPAIDLIDQTVESFRRDGITQIGVLQGSHELTDTRQPVQVASIQTLMRRKIPHADLVVVDEAHRWFDFMARWMGEWNNIPFIGLSATPWTKGLGKHYDDLIQVTTTAELIERGYLSPFRVYGPSKPDLSKCRIVAGDYNEQDLSAIMDEPKLVADVVETWCKNWGADKTLCFAVDRAHARHLAERFESVGISTGYVDAFTTREERAEIREKFHTGEIRVVCNVGCLCLDEETEILTRAGWRDIDTIQESDLIAAWSESGIEFTPPEAIVRRRRESGEKMVGVSSSANNVRVTGNHRMPFYSGRGEGVLKVVSAEELAGRRVSFPVSGFSNPEEFSFDGISPDVRRRRVNGLAYKYREQGIPVDDARWKAEAFADEQAQASKIKLPHELTDDECAFIGFWIGDGTRSGGRFSACQSHRYPKIIDWFEGVLNRTGIHHTATDRLPENGNNHSHRRWFFSTGLGAGDQRRAGGLASLLPYLDKSGSDLLWGLSASQFRALLHGLWMADGNHGDGETPSSRGRSIAIASTPLVDLLQAVCACRGIRTSSSWHGSTWRFSFQDRTRAYFGKAPLEIETDDFRDERVWCVTSSTSFLIVRRHGKVQVVGNTTGVDWDVRCIVLARPTKSEMLYVQIIGRGLRTADGKDSCMILDHTSTTENLGFVTEINHPALDDGKKSKSKSQAVKPEKLPKSCPSCTYLKPAGVHACPACGFAPQKPTALEEAEGKLIELTKAGKKRKCDKQAFFSALIGYARSKDFSIGWCAHTYRDYFGVWPNSLSRDPGPMTQECQSYITYKKIKYAHRRQA